MGNRAQLIHPHPEGQSTLSLFVYGTSLLECGAPPLLEQGLGFSE